jgi:hypothetical protein
MTGLMTHDGAAVKARNHGKQNKNRTRMQPN